MEKPCIFCSEKIRNEIFAETNDFRAIYNIAPIVPGHFMVIPKKHFARLSDMPEDMLGSFFIFARAMTIAVMNQFNSTGFDWTIQDGEEAGQTVPHVHLHVIPRFVGDFENPGDWYPALQSAREAIIDSASRSRLSREQIDQIVSHLKTAISEGR